MGGVEKQRGASCRWSIPPADVWRRGHVVRVGPGPVPVDDRDVGPRIEWPMATTSERPLDERRVYAHVVQAVADHPQVPLGVWRKRVVNDHRRCRPCGH